MGGQTTNGLGVAYTEGGYGGVADLARKDDGVKSQGRREQGYNEETNMRKDVGS